MNRKDHLSAGIRNLLEAARFGRVAERETQAAPDADALTNPAFMLASRTFENQFTLNATTTSWSGLASYLQQLDDETAILTSRLEAYCTIFTFHRRNRDLVECFKLHRKYEAVFNDCFFYHHLYAIALKENGRKRDIEAAIAAGRRAVTIAPQSIGAVHSLSLSLYMLCEVNDFKATDCGAVLGEALDLVDEALAAENYAKFYSTKALILSAKGKFDDARDAIREAIEREDSKRSDYQLRLSDYFSVRSQIELRRRMNEVTAYADTAIHAALDEGRKSNIETLSFFVAAISFIIGGLNLVNKFTAPDLIGLLFSLSASLMLSIAGFSLFYGGSGRLRRFAAVFVVAIVMILIGFGARWVWGTYLV